MKFVLAAVAVLSILASSSAFAAMDKGAREQFGAQCQKQMYMSGAQCACMADVADKTLDETAIAYLSLNATDVTNSAALSKSMTAAERNSIDHFMSTAPHQCESAK